ncbi:HCCA isomerase/glutathione S-transferase kappa [Amniculicola lignicola CBS 123094]|uniref:Glutathione S-transferase kappa n=1 Tax=Amniculicola lignicola CBS 123094 TaxID=1392246 RepID=A0A6A5WAU6_9PLEO|nr:HCCA isomerase/glutathione S-transferase kappa [Amniculicola lignicola CBS 123094]
MAKPKITLYVDIVSPFAYIAFYALQNFPVFKQCEITYIPILLGGLMKQCGNTPPLQVKNKDKWIATERSRWSDLLHIPISKTTPPGFPINTIAIQRTLCSIELSHPQSLTSAISLFFQNFWVHYNEPTKPENLLAIVRTVLGDDETAKTIVGRQGSDEIKAQLKGNTDRAFNEGAFGLPWFVATNERGETEKFWGVDHLGQLCDHLGLERPGGRGWRALL